jgi:MscS family membrane protein
VNSIDNFYSSVSHLKVLDGVTEYRSWHSFIKDRMPEWTGEDFFIFKKGQWMGLLAILLISISFFGLARAIATFILRIKIRQKSLDLNVEEQYESTMPFGCLLFSLTWLVGVRQLEFDLEVLQIFTRGAYIATAFSAVWSTLKIVDYISLHFKKLAAKTTNRFDDVLVPMLSKTAKVLVLSFGALLIAHSLTFDVASILAGLGIGGVAVALAAKDTISNLFGSVTVLMDKPFHLGDYVVLEKGLEGTVEEVGFRSTRLRTPINSLVTLPNSVLANMAIDNYGMRKVRRFKTKLAIDHKTATSTMEEFCERIRYSIRMNPMVQTEDQFVSVYEITSSSIEILVSVYFLSSNMQSELVERQKLIFEIVNVANELGVKFSQPVQVVQG